MQRRQFLQQTTATALASTTAIAADTPAKRIRIAQIGTQHSHASGKLSTILDLDDLYECVAIAEPNATQRDKVASRNPYAKVPWRSVDEILSDQSIQAIAVETDIPDLVPTATRCLQAGKHIHLDKPAGESMAACRAMHA